MSTPNAIVTQQSSSRTFTGADFLVHALVSAGVTHVFGGHGGAVVPLIDAIAAHPDIEWVVCRCEVNASQAAAAYAKLHGTLGCCVGTSGPGAAHLMSGLIDADQDRVPLLCISGMKDTSHIRYADFQDIDQAAIFRMAGLALSEIVGDIHQLLPLTRNAFTLALASNRCTHLAVPINVQQDEIVGRSHFCLGTAFQSRVTTPATRLQVDTLAMALRTEIESKRHVLIACGYRAHTVGREVERLAELLHCPILTSFDGKGTTDEKHPLSFGVVGVYGNAGTPSSVDLLEDCDTVIAICVNDLTELITNKSGLQIRRLIQIDERLIAGDSLRFSPSAVFSCGYLRESLGRVVAELEKTINKCEEHRRRPTVIETIDFSHIDTHEPKTSRDVWEEIKKESFVKPTGTPSTLLQGKEYTGSSDIVSTEHCHPAIFFNVMADYLDEDSVVCADIGDNALWMASSLAAQRGQRFLSSEHLGIMGYALNSGIAASLSAVHEAKKKDVSVPKKTLIVAGDGGIQMSLNELATIRDHEAKNVLVVVIINARLGRVQNETWGPRVRADGCHIGSPDYVKLFEAYSYPDGMRLSTCDTETISQTIEKGWKAAEEHGCCVIELIQDENVHPIMHKLAPPESSSLVHWEDRNRNPKAHSLFPRIQVRTNIHEQIQTWLNGLTKVELSDSYWLNEGDFFSTPPSEIVESLFDSLAPTTSDGSAMGKFFATAEATEAFDSQYHSSFLNALPAKVVVEEVNSQGTSNSHPLKMQLLACAKGFTFKLHTHPNVELMVPLVGELWERRLIGKTVNPDLVRRQLPTHLSPAKFYHAPDEKEIGRVKQSLQTIMANIKNLGKGGKFVDRAAREGQVLYNEIGSIHQSYSKNEGCLLLVLWSGLHADFEDCSCCTGIEGAENLFLP